MKASHCPSRRLQKGTAPKPQSEPQAVSDGLENHSATAAVPLDLPVIEGLATRPTALRAQGRLPSSTSRRSSASLNSRPARPKRSARLSCIGDLAGVERMVQSLKTAAGDIGATAAESAAAALARATHEQADPGEIESRWEELAKVVRVLVADLKHVLKPKEGKPAPARRPPAPAPSESRATAQGGERDFPSARGSGSRRKRLPEGQPRDVPLRVQFGGLRGIRAIR
jgi:hypothetical protein